VLDVGSGAASTRSSCARRAAQVTTVSLEPPADYVGDFLGWPSDKCDFDAVWACHVLEHQVDPGAFLRECRRRLRPGGWLAVTVPPLKAAIVGGHVTLWNAGLLLYQLMLAGFDCRQARVGTYGYNISVLVQNQPLELPALRHDAGDIERLASSSRCRSARASTASCPMCAGTSSRRTAPKPCRSVAILGSGPSLEEYVRISSSARRPRRVLRRGVGHQRVGDVIACDRVFHMDDVRIQEIRAAAKPRATSPRMLGWIKRIPGRSTPAARIRTIRAWSHSRSRRCSTARQPTSTHGGLCGGLRDPPRREEALLFGIDFTYPNAHDAEKGRACVEFWLGIAAARGIKLAHAEARRA
jgi:hypothetical protein